MKYSNFVISTQLDFEYKDLVCPNNKRNKKIKELAVVNNIPSRIGNNVAGIVEITATKIITSGKNPEVPGNPTLANDIIIKKNEKTGIEVNNPENAIIDRVWYRSDRIPTK